MFCGLVIHVDPHASRKSTFRLFDLDFKPSMKSNGYRPLPGFVCLLKPACARQSFFHRYTVTYECILEYFETLIGSGTNPAEMTFVQISLRGIIVLIASLIMIRLGSKRSLAQKTVFDGANRHSRVDARSHNQRQCTIFPNAQLWICSGFSASISRLDRLSLARFRDFDQGRTARNRKKRGCAVGSNAPKLYFHTRLGRGPASGCQNRRS
jgi:hypothetical protein